MDVLDLGRRSVGSLMGSRKIEQPTTSDMANHGRTLDVR